METEGRADEGSSSQRDPQNTGSYDFSLTPQDSLPTEDSQPAEKSVPIEEPIVVDRKAIEKLTEGLLSHYLPDLYSSKQALLELNQNQVILLDTLDQEVTKFRECNSLLDLNSLVHLSVWLAGWLAHLKRILSLSTPPVPCRTDGCL
uniref:Biogenesis of lysosomal organelles complex-1, subunit 6, pallidin n=1 Tax=Salmo trutta TaxID=8032 RepID=A0A674BCH6_SALTR